MNERSPQTPDSYRRPDLGPLRPEPADAVIAKARAALGEN